MLPEEPPIIKIRELNAKESINKKIESILYKMEQKILSLNLNKEYELEDIDILKKFYEAVKKFAEMIKIEIGYFQKEMANPELSSTAKQINNSILRELLGAYNHLVEYDVDLQTLGQVMEGHEPHAKMRKDIGDLCEVLTKLYEKIISEEDRSIKYVEELKSLTQELLQKNIKTA